MHSLQGFGEGPSLVRIRVRDPGGRANVAPDRGVSRACLHRRPQGVPPRPRRHWHVFRWLSLSAVCYQWAPTGVYLEGLSSSSASNSRSSLRPERLFCVFDYIFRDFNLLTATFINFTLLFSTSSSSFGVSSSFISDILLSRWLWALSTVFFRSETCYSA